MPDVDLSLPLSLSPSRFLQKPKSPKIGGKWAAAAAAAAKFNPAGGPRLGWMADGGRESGGRKESEGGGR